MRVVQSLSRVAALIVLAAFSLTIAYPLTSDSASAMPHNDQFHVDDCISACMQSERAPENRLAINHRKKDKEKQPEPPQVVELREYNHYHSSNYRTVYTYAERKIFIHNSLLRI